MSEHTPFANEEAVWIWIGSREYCITVRKDLKDDNGRRKWMEYYNSFGIDINEDLFYGYRVEAAVAGILTSWGRTFGFSLDAIASAVVMLGQQVELLGGWEAFEDALTALKDQDHAGEEWKDGSGKAEAKPGKITLTRDQIQAMRKEEHDEAAALAKGGGELVRCPICGHIFRERGLHIHVRRKHPAPQGGAQSAPPSPTP